MVERKAPRRVTAASHRRAPRSRLRGLLRATLGVLALVLPLAAGAQRAELQNRILRRTLPNGLELIVVENHGVPLVTIEADVRNGSFTQGPDFEGLSARSSGHPGRAGR